MKRFCVLGNSHVGAIKTGWDRLLQADRPVAMDFFASRSQTLAQAYVDGCVLKSDDEAVRKSLEMTGGSPEIDLERYDGFIVVGGGVHFRSLAQMIEVATLHPQSDYGRRLVSQAVLVESFRARIEKAAAWRLVEAIAAARRAPVHFMPEPFFGPVVLQLGKQPYTKMVHEQGLAASFAEIFDAACGKAFSRHGLFSPQPADTREDFMFTAQRYSHDAIGIRKMVGLGPQPRKTEDYTHKNAAYGELMLRSFLSLAPI